MVKIDELPAEILMKIFTYLPRYRDVYLVNRVFYDIACSVNDSNNCIQLSENFLKSGRSETVIKSIQDTRRKISKLNIDFNLMEMRELAISHTMTILKKFSATIRYLRLAYISLTMSEYLEILSLVPNVECLILFYVVEMREEKQGLSSNDDQLLPLYQLKTLKLECCSEQIRVVFNRLPTGVLKELDCKEARYDWRHATLLAKQITLKTLILHRGEIDNHILNVITDNLIELETLQITVNVALAVPFKNNIVKLRKLKNFTLESVKLEIVRKFAELDNSRISILNLTNTSVFAPEIDEISNVIRKLVISVPNLKVFRFNRYGADAMIMQNFNFLTVLEIHFRGNINVNELIGMIDDDQCFNPKLTELTIHGVPLKVSLLKKLTQNYPNLKKVAFYIATPIILSSFKFILDGFRKMESLILRTTIGTAEECLDYLRDNKNNLKSVTLTCSPEINSQFTERKKRLAAIFDYVEYVGGILYMTDE